MDDVDSPENHKSSSKKIKALGTSIGVDDSMPFAVPFNPGGYGLVKFDTEKTLYEVADYGDGGPTVRQLEAMRRLDGQARALFRLLMLPIRAALPNCTYVPAEGGEEEAKFIENVFTLPPSKGGMTTTMQRFMDHLLGALFVGFSAFEKVFWIPEYGPLKGKITLKKLAHRPSTSVMFTADRHGGFAGFRQRTTFAGQAVDVHIPKDYAFYYAAQEAERKFYGVSFFQSAFPHYDAKVRLYYTAHVAAARNAVGTRVGTVPPNAGKQAKAEFTKSLANLSVAQWMTTPEGFKVEVLKEGGSFDFLGLINHHNHMMAQSILAGFFDSDTGGGANESGSLVNFAKPGDDMFILMLRAIMDDIAAQINHYIIPQLIDFNFNDGKYPTFTWGTLTDEQKQAISATFDKLAAAGESLLASPEFMRELEKKVAEEMGLEIDWDEVEAREAEDKAKAEAMEMGLTPPGMAADPYAAVPAGAEDEASSLSDMVGLLGAKAEMEAGVAQVANENATGGPAKGAQPPGNGPAQQPTDLAKKRKKPGGQVGLVGLSNDMIEWADRMLVTTGKDYRDG